jgi:sugar phosphate permease
MSAEKTSRLRRIQWIAVAFLTAAGIINYLDRSALSIANTAIREEMGLTPTQMGLLLSAFSEPGRKGVEWYQGVVISPARSRGGG